MLKARDEAKIAENFAKLLVRLRTAQGLSLREAAKQIGIHHARLTSLERGVDRQTGSKTLPALHQMVDIARVYHYDKERLLMEAGYLPWMLNAEQMERLLHFMKTPQEAPAPLLAAEQNPPKRPYRTEE